MADREDQSNLPPIPDGGLTDAMPDWLRQPPAWRTLPDREMTPPESDDTAGLPESDESVIDPRTFLTDDDLPAWLKNLGPGRGARAPVDREGVVPDVETTYPATRGSGSQDSGQPADGRSAPPASRFVPATPPAAPATSTYDDEQRAVAQPSSSQPEPAMSPAWQGAWIVALLASLLVVAIAVIIVLVL